MRTLLFRTVLMAALAATLGGRAQEPEIIARARAYLGTEATLDSVRSLHFVGTLTTRTPSDAKKGVEKAVDIIFQKPWQHRIVVDDGQAIRTVGLDDYDAWERVQDPADLRRSRVLILSLAMVRSLKADVLENLGYFRGLERVGGSVKDLGPANVEGVDCEKIAFVHPFNRTFYRYFDRTTGRIVYSEAHSADGTTYRVWEKGELESGGIRFPRSVVSKHLDAKGREETNTYQFDKITVNEVFPESLFMVPPPQPPPPAASANPAKGAGSAGSKVGP